MNVPSTTLTLCVPRAADGWRLDVYLSRMAASSPGQEPPCAALRDMSRSRLQQLIAGGDVVVAGIITRASNKVRAGQSVVVRIPAPRPARLAPVPLDLDVVFEDGELLVLNKAAGLVVHPGAGHTGPTLVHGLLAHCRDLSGIGGVLRPGIVHRLDAGTSGLMVVAKSDRAHVGLARQFAARSVTKRYLAAVFGTPSPNEATIETWYARHPVHRHRFTSRVPVPASAAAPLGARRARTTYRVLCAKFGLAMVDVLLGTGRTHQIRVHLGDRGHPLVGDPVYGGRQYPRINSPTVRALAQRWPHQALHAAALAFVHPTTCAPMSFYAPAPALLVDLYKALAHPAAD